MNEVEVKAKVASFAVIQSQLAKLGCVFSEPSLQKDRIYLPIGVEFPDKTKGTLFLRIRDSNGKHSLTLKKQLDTEFENIERELIIDDPEQADEMLKLMGFHEVLQVSKRRTKCKYQDMTICLDEVDELGTFIEVEKLTSDTETQPVMTQLFAFLERLGIKKEDRVFKGYATLIYELHHK